MIQRNGISPVAKANLYRKDNSLLDHLPWVEAIEGASAILLEDGVSVGACFEIKPKATEGRSAEDLVETRDTIINALQDSFPPYDVDQWTIQTYTFNEPQLDGFVDSVENYVSPQAKGTEFTQHYLSILRKHYKSICKSGGLFYDSRVTRTPWRGCQQRTYVVVYRRSEDATLEALNDVCTRFFESLKTSGVASRRLTGAEIHRWLSRWFNMYTTTDPENPLGLSDSIEHGDDSLPFGDEFAESLFYANPVSNHEKKYWQIDQTYSRCISAQGIRRVPEVGKLTGEMKNGDAFNTVMDQLPESTIMVTTVVVVPADTTEGQIERIWRSAKGDTAESIRTRQDCTGAKALLGENHRLFRAKYAFYVNANSPELLERRTQDARSILISKGLQVVAVENDVKSLDSYIVNLPMSYDANLDRATGWTEAKVTWTQHIASLSPYFGRATGTGNPGFLLSNRGGEPLTFDPFNKEDKQQNSHVFMTGQTGGGKSVALGGALTHQLAMRRPRIFVIEAGNSFGLMAEWYKSKGLTVNAISLKPGLAPSLPTFKDAYKILGSKDENAKLDDKEFATDDEGGDDRDILGEMEILATLMVTGAEQREYEALRRAHKSTIRQAIVRAARDAKENGGYEILTEHVRDAFYHLADEETDPASATITRDMGKSMDAFCMGFTADVFNKPGELWPEADVTLIDLAQFAREGYSSQLSIAMIGLLNVINNIAERDQHEGRQIIIAIDEAHVIAEQEQLNNYLAKAARMWRKLGASLWLATQAIETMPDHARGILSLLEWWFCLGTNEKGVADIERFITLSPEQRKMILSTSKLDGKYSEGVVISRNVSALFRSVPPSIMLSLAMTNMDEKAERRAMMDEHGLSELEAALKIAANIDIARGITCD